MSQFKNMIRVRGAEDGRIEFSTDGGEAWEDTGLTVWDIGFVKNMQEKLEGKAARYDQLKGIWPAIHEAAALKLMEQVRDLETKLDAERRAHDSTLNDLAERGESLRQVKENRDLFQRLYDKERRAREAGDAQLKKKR